ncbi:MAG: hypothetical protein HYZ01_02880 [Ignavibacteriales bacterium]|nr:hypothetical protein [Ignavibacteriales bacterium]
MRKLSLLVTVIITLEQSLAQFNVLVNDFPVSEVINASVYRPALAAAPNGSYAVTWGDERYGNTNRASGAGNIFGRIIGSNGAPLTANFRVDDIAANTYYTDHWIFFSSPLFLPAGQLVVVWHVNGASGIGGIQANDVYYTAFNGSTGARLGAGVQLNMAGNTTGGHATKPNVAYRPPSTFLAVYEYSKNGNNIGGTLVDVNSGARIGDAFEMSDNAFNARIYPHVTSNGNYTVCVWTDGRTDTQLGDIYSERIVGNNLASTNVKVNDDPAGGYNQYARVAMDAQGNYVVVWIDARSSSFGDLYAQRFDPQGNRIGTNFKLTKSNSLLHEYPPGISMKSDGSFVVTWADSVRQVGKNWSIKTRFFGSTGQPLSDIIEVTNAPSLQPDVKIGPTGTIYYAWLDGRENATLGRIYSKIYSGFPITAIEESHAPLLFSLEQNYPNPFNPSATIRFTLPIAASVTLKVYDVLGREVAELVNQALGAGVFTYRFDAATLAGGSYYCRMTAMGVENGKGRTFSAVRKLVLMK